MLVVSSHKINKKFTNLIVMKNIVKIDVLVALLNLTTITSHNFWGGGVLDLSNGFLYNKIRVYMVVSMVQYAIHIVRYVLYRVKKSIVL